MQYVLSVIFADLRILRFYGIFTNSVCNIEMFLVHAMKAHGEVELQLHSFLTSTLDGREFSDSHTCLIAPSRESSVPFE
jgi:hypothetical protein